MWCWQKIICPTAEWVSRQCVSRLKRAEMFPRDVRVGPPAYSDAFSKNLGGGGGVVDVNEYKCYT